SEASYLLGLVLAYQGLYAEALTLIDEGLVAKPDDANLQMARTQVLDMRAAALSTPGADAAMPEQQLTAGVSRSTIDRPGFADWNDRFVEYRNIEADGGQQYLRVEHNHRFGMHDTQLEGGLRLLPDSALPLEVAVGFTPSDDFMPEYFARIGSGKLIAENPRYGALVATGQYQHASYANGRTNRILAGLEYYLPGIDAWLTPSIGAVRDQDGTETFAWTLGAHWQVNGRSRLGVNYSDAPETENLLTIDTRAWGAYWRVDLGRRVRLFLSYNRLDRENSYVREGVDVALQLRF
ncbi:MAG: YaiO family outer membrane beta-barrel protein, partial [Pseudomonadota bacterium]|nr:YaiO family outer membrane beta-barrel protein [Pseudomonadota bacterium]